MKRKLVEIYNPRNNSFTLLSLVLSLLILYFHAYPLFYGPQTIKVDIISSTIAGENLGSIIVAMFFIISGFMITFSIEKSKSIWKYLKKRIGKIFPTLILCILFTALVVAPIISDIPKFDFIKNVDLYKKYIIDNILLWRNTVYSIADVFVSNPYPAAINGSIWTLKHQFFMYLLIIPIYLIFIKNNKDKNKFSILLLFILLITMISYTGYYDVYFAKLSGKFNNIGIFVEGNQLIKLIYYFLAGVFLNINKDRIYYSKTTIIVSILSILLTYKTLIFRYLVLILLPYLTIYLGSLKTKVKILDISYQIFVFGFPVQQLIIYYCYKDINIWSYIFLSLTITTVIAIIVAYLLKFLKKLSDIVIKSKVMNNISDYFHNLKVVKE